VGVASTFRSTRDIIVRTENLAAATAFYQSVLGFAAEQHGDTLVGFETGAFRLYVEQGKSHGPVMEFLVPDVEDAKRELLSAGRVVVEEEASIPRCYLRDPNGIVFNVGQAK
jgi:catechol 2,3-dioxygenase-like lactoylglutathione lyase family enzyme